VFIEFVDEELAAAFMEAVGKDTHLKALVNDRKEKPIVEHAFFDTRVLHRKEEVIRRNQERNKKPQDQARLLELIKAPNKVKGNKPIPAKKDSVVTTEGEKVVAGDNDLRKEVKRQKKIQKATAETNRKEAARILVDQALEKRDQKIGKQAVDAIGKIVGRGMRNRLKRKLEKGLALSKEQIMTAN
jgi:hypothetical protein